VDLPRLRLHIPTDFAEAVALVAELVGSVRTLGGDTMSRPLCATARCRSRQHKPDCVGEECRGCLPYPAADGAYLCGLHGERIGTDALEAARLFGELEHRLIGGSSGDKVRSEPGSKYPDQRAIDVRTEIRHTLASWCRLIAEERGTSLPVDEVTAMGEFVAQHASWLAAQPFAADVSDELHALKSKAWSAAYPSGTHVVEIGACPSTVFTEVVGSVMTATYMQPCTGTLRAVMRRADSLLPSEVVCTADASHRWGASQWHAMAKAMRRSAA
jgi:hypothetical protein